MSPEQRERGRQEGPGEEGEAGNKEQRTQTGIDFLKEVSLLHPQIPGTWRSSRRASIKTGVVAIHAKKSWWGKIFLFQISRVPSLRIIACLKHGCL